MERDDSGTDDVLSMLRRNWWFPDIRGLRPGVGLATYHAFPLDDQPPVGRPDASLSWLADKRAHPDWSINSSDVPPVRKLNRRELSALRPPGVKMPVALATLAARTDLQRKIRSATACYLDLGDKVAPTSIEGGYLIHVLSDQQWVRHWLVYLDRHGNEAVLTTPERVGFEVADDDEYEPPPTIIPLDGSFDIDVCADSVAEFLFRLWVENEVYFATGDLRTSHPEVASYAAALGGQDGA